MKRRLIVQAGMGLVGTPALVGFAQAKKRLKLGHQFPAGSMPDRAAQNLAKQVATQSKGLVELQVFGQASLGDEREQLSLLRKGVLDLAITGDLVVTNLNPAYLVVNMPFLYRDAAHALATYNGPVGEMLRKDLAAAGLRPLSWHHIGTRTLTAQKPIPDRTALNGLKLRLPPDAAWMAVWRALGANPQPVPFDQLHAALKLGQVQAQENPPNFTKNGKFFEHQSHLMTTRHMPQRQFVFASATAWKTWPKSLRHMLIDTTTGVSTWVSKTAALEEASDMAWLLSSGNMTEVAFNQQDTTGLLSKVARDLGGKAGLDIYNRILNIA